ALAPAPRIAFPHEFVEAVVEIKVLEPLEFAFGRREQLLGALDVPIHGAADVVEHQDLDGVAPLRSHADVEIALVGRVFDGSVEVELVGGALARELAQPSQSELDIACAELDLVVEIAEFAPVPDLEGASMPAGLLPDAHAGRIVSVSPEGRRAAGADPFVAAAVGSLLLRETLAQLLHDLVPAAERLDLRLLLLAQIELGERAQPLRGNARFERLAQQLKAAKDVREDLVEPVEMAFVLHQGCARKIVEV